MTQSKSVQPLPGAPDQYDRRNEAELRRQVEQTVQDISTDMVVIRDLEDDASYLSALRMSFLFMGAVNG